MSVLSAGRRAGGGGGRDVHRPGAAVRSDGTLPESVNRPVGDGARIAMRRARLSDCCDRSDIARRAVAVAAGSYSYGETGTLPGSRWMDRMDALRHADAVLAALHRLHPECVLPGLAGSPMDDVATLVLPRALIEACEPADPALDAEMVRLARPHRPIEPRAAS